MDSFWRSLWFLLWFGFITYVKHSQNSFCNCLIIDDPLPFVQLQTFQQVKMHPFGKVVTFYDSTEAKSKELLNIVNDVGRVFDSKIKFVRVDNADPANTVDMQAADFEHFPYLFISTKEEGVEQFLGELSYKTLSEFVDVKTMNCSNDFIMEFTSEDSVSQLVEQGGFPVVVKFFESWCEHCQRIKPVFQKASYFLHDLAIFMEHVINGYPSVVMFDGSMDPIDTVVFDKHASLGELRRFVVEETLPERRQERFEMKRERDKDDFHPVIDPLISRVNYVDALVSSFESRITTLETLVDDLISELAYQTCLLDPNDPSCSSFGEMSTMGQAECGQNGLKDCDVGNLADLDDDTEAQNVPDTEKVIEVDLAHPGYSDPVVVKEAAKEP